MASLFDLGTLNQEDRFAMVRFADLLRQCGDGRTRFSAFLDTRQQQLAMAVMRREGWDHYLLWGGFEQAERRMLGVYESDKPSLEQFPIAALTVTGYEDFGHRDLLGALMHLGIKREGVGDLLVNGTQAAVYVSAALSETICTELTRVGRAVVTVRRGAAETAASDEPQAVRGTVNSLRVDAVLSLALRVSREKAQTLIRSGAVRCNHAPCLSVSAIMRQGDLLSITGYGRCELTAVEGRSRKDRQFVVLSVYKH